jgi:predicted RNase H-like nuclease (RuvC/YqgF family)
MPEKDEIRKLRRENKELRDTVYDLKRDLFETQKTCERLRIKFRQNTK